MGVCMAMAMASSPFILGTAGATVLSSLSLECQPGGQEIPCDCTALSDLADGKKDPECDDCHWKVNGHE